MREFRVEKDFEVDGFRCVVVAHSMGHRCGYVAIPKEHKLYEVDYDDIDVEVHGGLTYSTDSETYPVRNDGDIWWIGFDCAHSEDAKDLELMKSFEGNETISYMLALENRFPSGGEIRTTEFVEQELVNLIPQLKRMNFEVIK